MKKVGNSVEKCRGISYNNIGKTEIYMKYSDIVFVLYNRGEKKP